MKKGPQTIEKAKQGAYVSRAVSSLQRLRLRDGSFQGIVEKPDGSFRTGPYESVLRDLINTAPATELDGFILTVGVVSNHGNWFTADNYNKELLVLAQSYDWLLFLTDEGLSHFIETLLLAPMPELSAAREAFLNSYSGRPGGNVFTKVRMDANADSALKSYFADNSNQIRNWYNVIAPRHHTLEDLKSDLGKLAAKDWILA